MSVVHRVTGFHKVSERLERQFDVPTELVEQARSIANAPADAQQAPGAFALSQAAAHTLSQLLNVPMSSDQFDWFIEPVER